MNLGVFRQLSVASATCRNPRHQYAFFLLYQIERDDAEYILSTFNGIHETNPLFPGSRSTAQLILDTYDELRMNAV